MFNVHININIVHIKINMASFLLNWELANSVGVNSIIVVLIVTYPY